MPNMESLTSVMSRRSIDLTWVHIQGQREIRWHGIITWRLLQKTEIMTEGAVETALWTILAPGGTITATSPI